MPCLCGDTNCPSCGPAQGHNPAFERVVEWLFEHVLADFSPGFDTAWLAEDIASRLGRCDQEIADALESAAARWERAEAQARREARANG